jgi:septal ring factor EnvC (AmiA/AmiB activator)
MNPKDNIEQLFKNLKNTFDIAEPNTGHSHRFLDKLKHQNSEIIPPNSKKNSYWKPFLAVAASLVLCFSVLIVMQHGDNSPKDLASVSPELSQTQSFFATTIAQELAALEAQRSPQTEQMVDDALNALKVLETEYSSLKLDLNDSGNDKRVIYAMIANFQNRIDILQNVLKHIEDVKNFKLHQNENNVTI